MDFQNSKVNSNPLLRDSLLRVYYFVPFVFGRLSSVLVGFRILFFWYCLPKTVGLEGLPNLLLRELEDFVDFARILVFMCLLQPFSLNWGKWVNCLSQASIFSIVRSDWLKTTVSYNSRPVLSIPT